MMLDADVQTGIVVDRNGAVQGLLTMDTIAEKMREGEHAPAFAQELEPPEAEIGEPGPSRPSAPKKNRGLRPCSPASRSSTSTWIVEPPRRDRGSDPPAPAADDPAARLRVHHLAGARDLGGPPAARLRSRDRRRPGFSTRSRAWRRSRVLRADHQAVAHDSADPADDLHPADPRPEHRRRVQRRSGRHPRGGRRDGLYPPAAAVAGRDPAGRPADARGHPPRERHHDRPGDDRVRPRRRVRWSRPAHHRRAPDVLPDEVPPRRGPVRAARLRAPTSCSSGSSAS